MTRYLNTYYQETKEPLSVPFTPETENELCDACGHKFSIHVFDYNECDWDGCPCAVFIKNGERWLPMYDEVVP